MNILENFFVAVALSLDALVVALAYGFALNRLRLIDILKVGLFFGGFQALMPVIGWAAGLMFRDYILNYDHWIAFGLLSFIGGKMIYESLSKNDEPVKDENGFGLFVMLLLSIATSIDALAVGLGFSFLRVPILIPAIIIGSVTFIISAAGVGIGQKFKTLLGKKIELLGGIVLVGIGLKILVEHIQTGN